MERDTKRSCWYWACIAIEAGKHPHKDELIEGFLSEEPLPLTVRDYLVALARGGKLPKNQGRPMTTEERVHSALSALTIQFHFDTARQEIAGRKSNGQALPGTPTDIAYEELSEESEKEACDGERKPLSTSNLKKIAYRTKVDMKLLECWRRSQPTKQ